MKTLLSAIALAVALPAVAHAQAAPAPAPAPKKECCCKDMDRPMACCEKHGGKDGGEHEGHDRDKHPEAHR